ncbi:tetratricopeptide repeat protein [Micromonospora aurantiaca (nom. illeg.)]|uniref:tetratricopeptide repeat protein n=1 Tax=Micromonospora aurantiaca (nom. illeg.) TaxID=47850 RepID=UPI0033D9607B
MPLWPVVVGQPPALASAFQPREDLREKILNTRSCGDDVVLPHQARDHDGNARVLAGGGGVGKSQLAAWFAWDAINGRATDLVVWVNAASPDQVVTTYARAAAKAGVPGADGADPTADATALLEWLNSTERTWLFVLDNITDPALLGCWWPPPRPTGWTLATTRLQDATLFSSGRRKTDVGVYSPSESLMYLTDRLAGVGCAHLLDDQAPNLAAAVGHLPLALSHAAAYMIAQEEGCANYLARYKSGGEGLPDLMPASADPDAYGRPVAVTLLLALDAADGSAPVGLARPALALAAMADPAGHPDALWSTLAVTEYLSTHGRGDTGEPVTTDEAWKAMRLLHRYGLLIHTPTDTTRAVRIHALTARATRETTIDSVSVAHATADALLQLWPDADHATTDLINALRANTNTLADIAGDLLWQPHGHPLLSRAGISLLRAGLHTPAVAYWKHMTEQAVRLLGHEHPNTLTARANLAASFGQAGRITEAITIEERVATDSARLLGREHPDTLAAHANLATSYRRAGRTTEAIILIKRVVADYVQLLGDEHPHTLSARANLAASYGQAGRTTEAITIEERVAIDSARLLGDEHPDTLGARANLAVSYRRAGRTAEAIDLLTKVVDDFVGLLGDEHPDTLAARANLASSYRQAGRTAEAITIEEKVTAGRTRLLGEEHPDTLAARTNLAVSYRRAGRTAEAIDLLTKVVDDFVRLLGEEHPSTLIARTNLAVSYRRAGHTAEAIDLLTKVVDDFVRLLGEEHPSTLTARANLAASYRQAGRTAEAIDLLTRVTADSTRLLGDDHPNTVATAGALREWRGEA